MYIKFTSNKTIYFYISLFLVCHEKDRVLLPSYVIMKLCAFLIHMSHKYNVGKVSLVPLLRHKLVESIVR